MITVSHLGIHWSEGVAYLHQPSGNVNALGLKGSSPFRVAPEAPRIETHLDLRHTMKPEVVGSLLGQLALHPLVRMMEPLPGGGIVQMDQHYYTPVVQLSYMAGRVEVFHWKAFTGTASNRERLRRLVNGTNVAPLIIYGLTISETALARSIATDCQFAPRRIVLLKKEDMAVPGITHINCDPETTKAIMKITPAEWRQYGSLVVQNYMLGEHGTS